MKKFTLTLTGLILAMGLIVGCGQNQNQVQSSPTETQPPQQQTETQTPATTPQTPSQSTVDTSNFIGEEKAKEIALKRAGIAADGVIFDRVELDRDDGVWQYEVDFRQGNTEYDVDIKAEDGAIINYEQDLND